MKYVTRQIKFYNVTVVCIDVKENKVVEQQTVSFAPIKNEEKFIKNFNLTHEGLKASYIKSVNEDSTLYGVPYDDFMKSAVKMVDFRTPLSTAKSKK